MNFNTKKITLTKELLCAVLIGAIIPVPIGIILSITEPVLHYHFGYVCFIPLLVSVVLFFLFGGVAIGMHRDRIEIEGKLSKADARGLKWVIGFLNLLSGIGLFKLLENLADIHFSDDTSIGGQILLGIICSLVVGHGYYLIAKPILSKFIKF